MIKMSIFVMFFAMRRICYLIYTMLLVPMVLAAQEQYSPKYEYRAVWLTTVENLDWPRTKVRNRSDIAVQQNELVAILDSLKAMNVNTVLLQTRLRGDVIYRVAVHEIMYMNEAMKNSVLSEKNLEVLRKLSMENGMVPLWDSCKKLVLKGVTSLQEMMSLNIE